MEIETSDAERTRANADVLATVESEIVLLEQKFSELASLETERDRLSAAVQSLTKEEAATLAETTLSESVIVKKLAETRGRRDVQSARLISIQNKIKAHTADLADQGANVRRAFGRALAPLHTARQQRVVAMLTELFGAPFIYSHDGLRIQVLRELSDQTVLMKQTQRLQ